MYRKAELTSRLPSDFELPFEGRLSKDNRWVKMAELIPWSEFESDYAENFPTFMGAPAKSFRMALGALIIKEKLGISDIETVEQIRENPYLQYFIGQLTYSNEPPFDPSLLVHILYKSLKVKINKKPRTYRKIARKDYLAVAKQRRPLRNKKIQAIKKQLQYIKRNLAHIEQLIESGATLQSLSQKQYKTLLVLTEVYRQQLWLFENKKQSISDRIVSLSQPHIRPIARGKAGKPVEFGAKLSASCIEGYVFLDRISWDNFNESGDLKAQIEAFKNYTGYYPESVHADRIYRTRVNRAWCKERGIRISGPPLGRPPANVSKETKKQALQDERIRNAIEGKFGQGKRRFSLNRVMAKLDNTSQTAIAITFLVMNLSTWLRRVFCVFLCHKPKITPIYGAMIIKSYNWVSYSQEKVMSRSRLNCPSSAMSAVS
ncbi:MAG TPA: transposase [Kamptonema sp.]|nr:transposase [Kamptonema sp.]